MDRSIGDTAMQNTFSINRPTGYVKGEVEKITVTEGGKLTSANEPLDFSAWDATSTQERAAIFADVEANRPTGWNPNSSTKVPTALDLIRAPQSKGE